MEICESEETVCYLKLPLSVSGTLKVRNGMINKGLAIQTPVWAEGKNQHCHHCQRSNILYVAL